MGAGNKVDFFIVTPLPLEDAHEGRSSANGESMWSMKFCVIYPNCLQLKINTVLCFRKNVCSECATWNIQILVWTKVKYRLIHQVFQNNSCKTQGWTKIVVLMLGNVNCFLHRYVLLLILEVYMIAFNILLYQINTKQYYTNMKSAITSLYIHTCINTVTKVRTLIMNYIPN